jgi:hypothetical protein
MSNYFTTQCSPKSQKAFICLKTNSLHSLVGLMKNSIYMKVIIEHQQYDIDRGKIDPVPVTIYPPQINYGVIWDRTWVPLRQAFD